MLIDNDLAYEGRQAPSGVTRDAMPPPAKPQARWPGSPTRGVRARGHRAGAGSPA